MGLFKKISSVFGADTQKEVSSALDKLRELKQRIGIDDDEDKQEEDKETDDENLNDYDERDYDENSLDEYDDDEDDEDDDDEDDEDEDDEDEDDEYDDDEDDDDEDDDDEDDDDEDEDDEDDDDEDDDLVENRAKPIFIVHLKRINIPLTRTSLLEHKDELASYNSDCILMRNQTEDPDMASCFFGRSVDQLMKQALQTLDEWNEDMDEPIVPVLDYLAGIESYNCDIDSDTLRKVSYYIVNGYGEEADDYKENFPIKDSLVRIVSETDGQTTFKDVLAYPDWSLLDEDDEGWVERMISERGINY